MNAESIQPAVDDQDLAQVLTATDNQLPPVAGTDEPASDNTLQYEEAAAPENQSSETDATDETSDTTSVEAPSVSPLNPATFPTVSAADNNEGLESIKKDALNELRPLVEKLELPAEEKFDIMLLIIRSTDDHSLVMAAHNVAKLIENESKRAQALLDIVKEIDYFSSQNTA